MTATPKYTVCTGKALHVGTVMKLLYKIARTHKEKEGLGCAPMELQKRCFWSKASGSDRNYQDRKTHLKHSMFLKPILLTI